MARLLLVSFLLAVTLSIAWATTDVDCVMHSADCDTCLKSDCRWCDDGFCASATSEICSASKLSSTCSVQPAPIRARQSSGCSAITSCDTCLGTSGCLVCADSAGDFVCSSSCPNPYGNSSYNVKLSVCPSSPTLASDSPIINVGVPASAVIGPNGTVNVQVIKSYITSVLNNFLGTTIPSNTVIIISVTLPNGTTIDINAKRDALSASDTLKVTFGFANVVVGGDSISAQQLGATFLNVADTEGLPAFTGTTITPSAPTLAPNSPTIGVTPLTPSTGTGAVVNSHSKSNNNVSISKGALAGIIIGVFFGAVIIVALVLFFIVRRRDSYPAAFRSPAAAYRP